MLPYDGMPATPLLFSLVLPLSWAPATGEVRRDYAGPTSAEAPPGAVTAPRGDAQPAVPEDVAWTDDGAPRTTPPPAHTAPPAPPATTAPTAAPGDSASVEALAHARRIPRLLGSLTGEPEAEVAKHRRGRVTFVPGLQIRNQVNWISPFVIDRFGNRYEEGVFSTGRIRWNPKLKIGNKLRLVAMMDLANGIWAPGSSEDPIIQELYDPPPDARHEGYPPYGHPLQAPYPDIVDPRELYLEYRSMIGLLRIGQMSFLWGQGILSNSGNSMDRFGDMRFGGDGPGDLQERILFATKPFGGPIGSDMVLAIGADLVFRDERANLVEGDLAGQGFLVVRYQPAARPANWIGGYVVYRGQKSADDGDVYPDDDTLHAGVVDLAGQGVYDLSRDLALLGAFEGVLIGGKTTVARDEDGPHKILQGGFVVRGYVGDEDRWLVGFDAGYASGDPNPNDRWINNFTFDAGHRVGLVLFQAVQGFRTARSEVLATNGDLAGVPPNGTQFIPTRGAVTNAVYVHPKARWAFRRIFEVWGGPLIAAAPVPIVDPYTSNLAGGVPTNSVGGDGGARYYGTELDLGVRARFDVRKLWLQIGLQGGLLLPGLGLADAAQDTGGPVGAVFVRTEIRY